MSVEENIKNIKEELERLEKDTFVCPPPKIDKCFNIFNTLPQFETAIILRRKENKKMENLEELKKKYAELGEEIERLEKSKTKRWRAEKGGVFFWIDSNNDTWICCEDNCIADDKRYKSGNYFKTEEEAQAEAERRIIYQELSDLALELNNGVEIDWKNRGQQKYSLVYDYENEFVDWTGNVSSRVCGTVYCLNRYFRQKAIERIGEERLEKLLK